MKQKWVLTLVQRMWGGEDGAWGSVFLGDSQGSRGGALGDDVEGCVFLRPESREKEGCGGPRPGGRKPRPARGHDKGLADGQRASVLATEAD